MINMKKLIITILVLPFLIFALNVKAFAQNLEQTQVSQSNNNVVNNLLISKTDFRLYQAILEMNKRKAAIAYNVANASTPGFKPIRFEDEIQAAIALYGDDSILNQVHLDDEMIKATQIRLRHSAYVKLLTTKMGITKRVATLGKGG